MEAKLITREQAITRIEFNLPKLTEREVKLVDAFIQGLKRSRSQLGEKAN